MRSLLPLIAAALSAAGCTVGASTASPPTPPLLAANLGNLQGPWRFRTDPAETGLREGWHKPAYDDAPWRPICPGECWEAQGVTDPRPGAQPKPRGAMPWTDYDGVAWYRRSFTVPKAWRGKELLLYLDKVDDLDRTYVNGVLVGETTAAVQVPSQHVRRYRVPARIVRPGAANVVAVRVWDGGGPGGMLGAEPWLLPEDEMKKPVRLPGADRPLAQRFANPPADARILKIIHGWPDEPDSQDTLIRTLADQGFGGVVCNVSFDQYLKSDAKMKAFVRAVKAAKAAGMAMWLYDERGYPSGTAGGLTLQGRPEWEARGLLIADRIVGPGPVTLELPPGKLRDAAAYPLGGAGSRIDLGDRVAGGKLAWTAPEGRWHVAAITEDRLHDGTHATMSLAEHIPQINMLMAEPTRRFLEVTHGAYAEALGKDLGKYFAATFTDEPSLMSLFLKPMPYRPLPWSPAFAAEFKKRRGYDIEPRIALLAVDQGGASRKVRYDYWLTVSELVSSTFFGQIRDWCRAHNVQSGGHLLLEEPISAHVALYGDFLRSARMLDAPSIDCLSSIPPEVPWHVARLVSSAAELEGRTLTMSETSDHVQNFRPAGDTRPRRQVTVEEIRGTCNRLMVGGINTITSYYTFRGLTGPQLRALNAYIGRCATTLRGGRQVTDVAVVYPVESIWPTFRPSLSWATDSPEAARIQSVFGAVSDALYAARRDFTYVDSRALTAARVENGTLVHGKLRWRAVVLPAAHTLPAAAWQRLRQFAEAGGIVVAAGAIPANSERAFPDATVQRLAADLFGGGAEAEVRAVGRGGHAIVLPQGAEGLVASALDTVLQPPVRVIPAASSIRCTQRRIDGHDVFFLINDAPEPFAGKVSVSANGAGTLMDPLTGAMRPVATPTGVTLRLAPYSGVFLRFAASRLPQRRRPAAGPIAGLSPSPLALGAPTEGHGEFVTGGIERDPVPLPGGMSAVLARATLVRSAVDTHQFVRFPIQQPSGLAGAHALVLDTWVPEGQATGAQVVALLQERSGGIYIAEVGRPLGSPGHVTTFVSVDSFKLAAFSSDANGRLDLGDVVAINVGWGGYFGSQGEVIQLGVAPPRIARQR